MATSGWSSWNDEDMPQLRLNPAYKRLMTRDGNDRDTRNYVKDRYKSAIQLIKTSNNEADHRQSLLLDRGRARRIFWSAASTAKP